MSEVQENVGVTDEIGQEIIEAQRESFKGQIEMFEKNIEQIKKGKENYQVQWDVENRLYEIRLEGDNQTSVAPKFKYETVPEYTELIRKMVEFKYREEKFLAEQRLQAYDVQMKDLEEQKAGCEQRLKELDGSAQ